MIAEQSDANASLQARCGLLFDMDGTVLSSVAAAERVWTGWAQRHGLDVDAFLRKVHGVRAIDTIRNSGVVGIDVEAEAAAVLEAEIADLDGVEPIAGAAAFLASLPPTQWGIVTSAPERLARTRMQAAGLPRPPILVSGDDVSRGKPAPDAFVLGAQRLGCAVSECAVFEDAVAGIKSAESAGAAVVVVTAMHSVSASSRHASIVDYQHVRARRRADGRLDLGLNHAP